MTQQIITLFISGIKALRLLDPGGVSLDVARAARPPARLALVAARIPLPFCPFPSAWLRGPAPVK